MTLEVQVGPRLVADGSENKIRSGRTGELITSDAHGKYQEAASRGSLFIAANVGATTWSVALATTYTGLCISNPVGNTKNLVMLACQMALSVAPVAIASLHLIAGNGVNVTHTTPLASPGIQNCLVGIGPGASAKADSAATIVSPTYLFPLGSGFTAGALYATTPSWIDLGGIFVIPPGSWIALGALTAVIGFGAFLWEEVAI